MAKPPRNVAICLSEKLEADLEALIDVAQNTKISAAARKKLNARIEQLHKRLNDLVREIDPVRLPDSVFDPSEPELVGRFVALALVAQKRKSLTDFERFYGSGVYGIYYRGDFPGYSPISGSETPIYIGKADPAVSNARSIFDQGTRLSRRIADHRKNISKAINLDIEDFEYRALVVQSGWQTAAESYLIHLFSPIWNSETGILYGLGKHGDAATTRGNRRSPWDTLHPGRKWAASELLEDAKSLDTIRKQLETHFREVKIYHRSQEVLSGFLEELSQV